MKKLLALSGIALSLTLAACGGSGGGNDNSSATQNTSLPTPTPTPVPTKVPTPTPTPQPQPPSLSAPDAGSTAAVGNGFEGYWKSSLSTTTNPRLAIVAPDGTFVAYDSTSSTYWGGTATPAGTTWVASPAEQLVSGTLSAFNDSGTFVAKTSLTDATAGSAFVFDTYAPANALATTAASVVGTWGNGFPGKVIVAQDGSFTGSTLSSGSIGICNFSGTITPFDPSSKKNIFSVTVTATQSVTCHLVSGTSYTGLATIDVVNNGTQTAPVYAKNLVTIIRVPGQAYLWMQLAQQ